MRLLIVAPCYYPATRYGGPVRSVHSLAKALARLGDRVTVFTTNSDGPKDLSVPVGEPVQLDGVEVCYFPVQRPRGFFRSTALASELQRRVRSFDALYAPWIYAHTTIAAATNARRSGVPFVLSPRGMLARAGIRRHGWLKKRLYLATLGRPLFDADCVHYSSQSERENSIGRFPDSRCIFIPNPVEPVEHPATPPEDPNPGPTVVFLGRLSYIKGLELIADAWPIVVKSVPSAKLILAGPDDEDLFGTIRRRLESSGVMESVRYVGIVAGDQKGRLLMQCSVLLNPSYMESFGMSIMEALSLGKPVVVSERIDFADEIRSAGAGLVARHDARSIAGATIQLLLDKQLATAMGAAGRRLVEARYSSRSVAQAMHHALEMVIRRHQADVAR